VPHSRAEYHLERLRTLILSQDHVLAFDEAAAYRYGTIRAELEAAGTPLHSLDLQIAAIALAQDLILVTGNTRHFSRVSGLRVENWLV
jgi:tRNA(fMet)-specific endonuclease VapC